MWTGAFWRATTERAIRTFAQSLAGTLSTVMVAGQVSGTYSVPWQYALIASGLAALFSVLTSLGASQITNTPGPSLIEAEVLSPPAPPENRD